MENEKKYAFIQPTLMVSIIIYIIGIYAIIRGESGFWSYLATGIFFLFLFIFPALMAYFGRLMTKQINMERIPRCLFPTIFLYTFLTTSYAIIPTIANGFDIHSATEVVFLIFETVIFVGGIVFTIYFTRKRVRKLLTEQDIVLFLHYLVGGLVYFYFIRLTLLSTILLQSAYEALYFM